MIFEIFFSPLDGATALCIQILVYDFNKSNFEVHGLHLGNKYNTVLMALNGYEVVL